MKLYEKHFSFSFVSFFLSFYMSSKMNYPAQLEFYNLDDVYVTSRDNFAIVHFFGTSAFPHRLHSERLTPV